MNRFLDGLAHELLAEVREQMNLPFYSEEEEELFFQFIVAKLAEIVTRNLIFCLAIEQVD